MGLHDKFSRANSRILNLSKDKNHHSSNTMPDTSRQRPDVLDEYYEQSAKDKLVRASKENPAMPIALGLGTGVVAYMLYSLKTSKEKLSVHLIHTRVLAQGTIVCTLTGMPFNQFYHDMKKKQEEEGADFRWFRKD